MGVLIEEDHLATVCWVGGVFCVVLDSVLTHRVVKQHCLRVLAESVDNHVPVFVTGDTFKLIHAIQQDRCCIEPDSSMLFDYQ